MRKKFFKILVIITLNINIVYPQETREFHLRPPSVNDQGITRRSFAAMIAALTFPGFVTEWLLSEPATAKAEVFEYDGTQVVIEGIGEIAVRGGRKEERELIKELLLILLILQK